VAETFHYSRQHYYKQKLDLAQQLVEQQQVKALVLRQRKLLPRVGGRKIHYLISEALRENQLKFGRDKLFKLLRDCDLLIKPRRRYVQTTNSKHWLKKYPNMAKRLKVTGPEQLWVSDITYLKTQEGNCYLSMITDAYSRKIMGYSIADNMEAVTITEALKAAIKSRQHTDEKLVHHSDRGLQYCSYEYTRVQKEKNILISMTENSDPYENALAERMNRTIKEEFCLDQILITRSQAILAVKEAIHLYNNYRPHLSLSLKTPNQVHQKTQPPEAVGFI
jgi:putative transposase